MPLVRFRARATRFVSGRTLSVLTSVLSDMESTRMLSDMESSDAPVNAPAEDLELVSRAQGVLEPPRRFSFTYDVLYSIACGALVAGQALPMAVRPYASLAVLLAMFALMTWWRNRLGWWLNGTSPRRARWVAFALIVPLLALMIGVWAFPHFWVAVAAGIAGALTAFVASRLWMSVWRGERSSIENRP